MQRLRNLVEPALWIVAIYSLSRSIAAVRGFFTSPDLAGWAGALLWPALFLTAFFGLTVFQYARLKKQGKIKQPKRLYERLIGAEEEEEG